MQSATFVPVRESSLLASTGFRPQAGDSLFNVKSSKVLFPSPASIANPNPNPQPQPQPQPQP
jgi:hypothetical protein